MDPARNAIFSPTDRRKAPPNRKRTLKMSDTAETEIRRQLDRWFGAWSPGDKPFDAEPMRSLFADDGIHVVDDFGDHVVTIGSFNDYAATWNPVMAPIASWAIRPVGRPVVHVAGDLAAVTFVFSGGGRMQDGTEVRIAQHGTQIWRKRQGTWVIVHEHLTSDKPENVEG